MGLLTPKISPSELGMVQIALKQVKDCANLVNTTVKPDVFFGRLNMLLDKLLLLQRFERYKFKPSTPTKDYKRVIANLDATVNDFIDRAFAANQAKIASLKTEKAKRANYEKFVDSLISAFDCAHTFWPGDRGFPHYSGPLFTEVNYRRVQAIYDASCEDL